MFSKEEVREALEFLKVSRKDFEAAKLLIDNEYCFQGLFLLQQSIEKAAKAILRAIGLVDVEALRKEVGHDILVKGLRRLGYGSIEYFKNEVISALVSNLTSLCSLCSLCPEAFKHLENVFMKTAEGAITIQKWLDEKYDKGIRKLINELGNVIFQDSGDVRLRLDEKIDKVSLYVTDVITFVEEFGVEDLVRHYWEFERAFRACIKKHVKNHNQRVKTESVLNKYSRKFINLVVRILYLLDDYFLLLVYHTLFENKVSILRYPDFGRNWTPLSISENSIILVESRKIIDFMIKQDLMTTIEDFIKGEIAHARSKEVYDALSNYLQMLTP